MSGCESGPEVVVSPEAETLLDKMLQLCTWKHQDYTNSKDTKKRLTTIKNSRHHVIVLLRSYTYKRRPDGGN